MGLFPTGVRITSARTRYGSCSGKNSLCFSCFLMNCPDAAMDLVVVHELCHIQVKNHGPDFYALLEQVLPDWRERKKLLSRKAILDAAVREFSRKGFKETSVADIMNAADLGIGTFYNYFESKEEILMCLLGCLVDEVDKALRDMRAAKRPSYELLEAGSRITARFLDENRFLLPLFLAAAEHSAKPQTEAHDKMPKGMVTPGFKSIFEDILREGQLAGEIRDDAPADLIAEMFHSVYQAAAFSKLPIGFQENVALKTRLLLAGIRKA